MTLSLLASGVVNVYYTFADKSMKKPFEVPKYVLNAKKDELMKGGSLSDYITIIQNANDSQMSIKVAHRGVEIWNLEDIIL